jgi:hypothetical protein
MQNFDFNIPEKPKSLVEILSVCKNVMNNCVKTGLICNYKNLLILFNNNFLN